MHALRDGALDARASRVLGREDRGLLPRAPDAERLVLRLVLRFGADRDGPARRPRAGARRAERAPPAIGDGERDLDDRLRADAQRSVDALLAAASDLFATTGVDATTREIADRAGVGMGTLFRRFPQRADLIAAVFHDEMDACAGAATSLAAAHPPFEALARWLRGYAEFIGTKRGLAKALSAGDPVFAGVFARFAQRLRPAARTLYEAAVAAGEARPDLDAAEILCAVSTLGTSTYDGKPDHAVQMTALLVQELRVPH